MAFLDVETIQSELILDTPNRKEILKQGPPENSKCNILGRGSYGVVFKAVFGGKQVAVKIIKILSNSKDDAILNEANILGFQHCNIVQLLKIESTSNYGIVIMERFPGQCLQIILNSIELPLHHRIHIISDVANALVYCHNRNILHLDIKPQNILVAFASSDLYETKSTYYDRSYICKICDFGSSVVLTSNEQDYVRRKVQGTVRYMAPEALKEEVLSPAADVFSLGVTMWQLKTRQLPYSWIECNESVAYQVVKTNLRPTAKSSFAYDIQTNVIPYHKNCLCEQFSSEVSYRSLDEIRTSLQKTNTLSPFKPINRRSPTKKLYRKHISRNLISRFSDLKENLQIDKKSCNLLERQFCNDFSMKHLFENTSNLCVPAAENLYDELFNSCWHNEAIMRPKIIEVKNKLSSLLINTNCSS